MTKRLAIATAIGSLIACSDGSPTAPTPPANIAGSYTATITASSTCSANLPSATRVLNYIANVTQTDAAVQVQFMPHGGSTVTVTGTVSGQTVNFPSFSFSGNTAGGAVSGVVTGTANVAPDGSITGTLSGTYQTPSGLSCNAANHQLEMVKLCPQQTATGTALVPCQ